MSINNTLGKFIHFGRSNTFNPFSNSKDLKLLNERCFSIPSQTSFANTNAICIPTGLVSNGNSFLSSDFIAEVLETNGTRLTYLIPKLGTIGSNAYPGELDILWFDDEGIQSDYWINNKWAGKVLRLSGKFESSAIIVDEMNKLHTDRINIPNVIKQNPPPIGATYTQWNKNAPAPTSKWAGTTWQVVLTRKVLFKESVLRTTVESTHVLDNRTISIECDCIGGGGGDRRGGDSLVRYNNRTLIKGTGGDPRGGSGGGYGKGYVSQGANAFDGTAAAGVGAGCSGGNTYRGGSAGSCGADSEGLKISFGGSYYFALNPTMAGRKLIYMEPIFEFSDFVPGVRDFLCYVGAGGAGGAGYSAGTAGIIAFREYTNETVYVRTA